MLFIIAKEVKQSFMAFRKAHDSPSIWHSGCFWEFALSLRSSQNPFSINKIQLEFLLSAILSFNHFNI